MEKVEAIEDGIKLKSFGKTKPTTEKKKAAKATLSDTELLESQSKKIEAEIQKVKSEDQEPVAIRNPENNELVVEPEEIMRVTLKYCQDNLK